MPNKFESPKSLLERLQEKNPDRNVVITAIDELKSDDEIKEFFQQYAEWMKQGGESADPEEDAKSNIAFTVTQYSKAAAKRWQKALPEVWVESGGWENPTR